MKPIQGGGRHPHERGQVCDAVYMKAYEVYAHVYGPQIALIQGQCRGGFGKGELVAFLYAASFPKSEWRKRVDEAYEGMQL